MNFDVLEIVEALMINNDFRVYLVGLSLVSSLFVFVLWHITDLLLKIIEKKCK